MTALYFSPLRQCRISQIPDEVSESHIVVAALHAHIAGDARPDSLVHGAAAILTQSVLYYKARIELRVVSSYRTDHSAFAAIQTEADPGIFGNVLEVEHLPTSLNNKSRSD